MMSKFLSFFLSFHFKHILGHRVDDGNDDKNIYRIKDRNAKIKIKDVNESARPNGLTVN